MSLQLALSYKDKIEKCFAENLYSDKMFYYRKNTRSFMQPTIHGDTINTIHQFVSIDKDKNLMGYIEFNIDKYKLEASSFRVFKFNSDITEITNDLNQILYDLIYKFLHRVEIIVVDSDPFIDIYENLLKEYTYIANKFIFTDAVKDIKGNYHNEIMYEFINSNKV